jgi:hypothetical protein
MIHLGRDQLDSAARETYRVLVRGGSVLISVHRGTGSFHEDEALGKPVAFDCTLFEPEEMTGVVERAGFSLQEVTVRAPYDTEYPTTRVYVWGKKPQA